MRSQAIGPQRLIGAFGGRAARCQSARLSNQSLRRSEALEPALDHHAGFGDQRVDAAGRAEIEATRRPTIWTDDPVGEDQANGTRQIPGSGGCAASTGPIRSISSAPARCR